ncbi:MAG: hypothetical protein HYX27_00435 [Acidobacteria bacterium]|nr:hypothetical protein [Acidobacteriota bacterium]
MFKRKLFLAGMLLTIPLFAADVRVRINLGAGHPIVRPNRMVIVRPIRPSAVVVRGPVVYAPPVVWVSRAVPLPPRDRLLAEDSEVIHRREDWVDSTLNVNNNGKALYLSVDGRAHLDFAEVQFGNGQVQVVDFREGMVQAGTFPLLDFADGRHINSVRLVARSQTPRSKLTVLLAK